MTVKYKEKKVGMSESTNRKLDEIHVKRKAMEGLSAQALCFRKKDIIARLVADLHKKECK
jgi:hypothetical protein